jgi:hypothetical protein
MRGDNPFFEVRGIYECGWNIFCRKGYSTSPEDIMVNCRYLEHLAEAGFNWLVVFWTNSKGFNDAWEEASKVAHELGIRLARGIYGFSGGGPEHTMAEPNVPVHLLRHSPQGEKTALCPLEEETREWMRSMLPERLWPDMDGIVIEPAREISRNCICPDCQRLLPYKWDVIVINYLTECILDLNPSVEVMPYLNMGVQKEEKERWSRELQALNPNIKHIFAWGMDDQESLRDWVEVDPRFGPLIKLGRVILFPGGRPPEKSVEERVDLLFKWVKLMADRRKQGVLIDYRIFGGWEWLGKGLPTTKVSHKIPASLAVAGAALKNPYLSKEEISQLLEYLKEVADWDMDDPEYFYRGGDLS